MQLGRYTVLGKLATGGMAEVLLAQLTGTSGFEKRVVIKRVLAQYAGHAEFLKLFEQEARFASYLVHPHISQVFDFGVDATGAAYLVMEFIDGASLRTLLTNATKQGERPDVRLVCRVFSQVAEALAAVHSAVEPTTKQPLDLVHRDVSPENVLLSRQGAVKLADFGIARAMNEVSTTSPDVVRGKLRYLAPEQVTGEPLSPAIDVWALGVSLYETLALRRPFPEENEGQTVHAIVNVDFPPLERVRPDLPPELVAVVNRCLRAEPSERYPDCQDLALELERLASSGSAAVTSRIIGNWVDRLVPSDARLQSMSGVQPAFEPGALRSATPVPVDVTRPELTPAGAGLDAVASPSGRGAFGTAADLDSGGHTASGSAGSTSGRAADLGARGDVAVSGSAGSASGREAFGTSADLDPGGNAAAGSAGSTSGRGAFGDAAASPSAGSAGGRADLSSVGSAGGQGHAGVDLAAAREANPGRFGLASADTTGAEPAPDVGSSRPGRAAIAAVVMVLALLVAGFFLKDRVPRMRSSAVRAVLITSAPNGATVKQGSLLLGSTPWAGDLPASQVELTVDAPGYQAQKRVLAREATSLHVVLKRDR